MLAQVNRAPNSTLKMVNFIRLRNVLCPLSMLAPEFIILYLLYRIGLCDGGDRARSLGAAKASLELLLILRLVLCFSYKVKSPDLAI